MSHLHWRGGSFVDRELKNLTAPCWKLGYDFVSFEKLERTILIPEEFTVKTMPQTGDPHHEQFIVTLTNPHLRNTIARIDSV